MTRGDPRANSDTFHVIVPAGVDPGSAAPNHSSRFFADEGALALGVRALAGIAADYLHTAGAAERDRR